ncbi:MAG: hypothetical protein ACRESZ_02310, partial [Methylococcales bacterium]
MHELQTRGLGGLPGAIRGVRDVALPVILAAVLDMKRKLAEYPGIVAIEDSRRPGKPELRLTLTARAEGLGLRLRDLAEQVRQAYFGEEAQRFIRGREEV